jgi:glucokinase
VGPSPAAGKSGSTIRERVKSAKGGVSVYGSADRRPLFVFFMNKTLVLGADIGGTHITTALIDLASSSILPGTMVRRQVNSHASAAEIISVWCAALQEAAGFRTLVPKRIGMAMPGPFDYEAGICLIQGQHKYEALYGLHIKDLLATAMGIETRDIRLQNDAGAFLRGEIFAGAAKGARDVIGVTLGTGLGTSRSHQGVAADANLWCLPFWDSIAEDYLSARWLVQRYATLSGRKVADVKALAALVSQDDKVRTIFAEFGQALGFFLAEFICLDQPEVIVVGGNIARAAELFLPETRKVLALQGTAVPLKLALLGEEASLIGAASCWQA